MKASTGILNYKKANIVVETATIIIVISVLAIFAIIALQISDDLNTDIQVDLDLSNETKQLSNDIYNYTPNLADDIFVFAFVLLWAFAIISAFLIDTNPMFLIFTLLLFGVLLYVGAALSNGWIELFSDPDWSNYAEDLPKTNFVFNNFVYVIMAFIATIGIALYAKNRI
jgi:hypothetical protein